MLYHYRILDSIFLPACFHHQLAQVLCFFLEPENKLTEKLKDSKIGENIA